MPDFPKNIIDRVSTFFSQDSAKYKIFTEILVKNLTLSTEIGVNGTFPGMAKTLPLPAPKGRLRGVDIDRRSGEFATR